MQVRAVQQAKKVKKEKKNACESRNMFWNLTYFISSVANFENKNNNFKVKLKEFIFDSVKINLKCET